MFPDLFRDDVFRLETRRLWLRWPRLSDAKAAHHLVRQEPSSCHQGEAELAINRAIQNNLFGKTLTLMITMKSGARPVIGVVELAQDIEARNMVLLRYSIESEHQELATEAVSAALNAIFSYTPYQAVRFCSNDLDQNEGKMLQKCGFENDTLNRHRWNNLKRTRPYEPTTPKAFPVLDAV
jgi:RimJ/RimL family protein N-acetyltransferase